MGLAEQIDWKDLRDGQIKLLAADERFACVVVSCREKDFADFSLPFNTLTLQPLTPPRVRDFLHQIFALTRGQAAEDEAEARFWLIAGGDAVRDAWETWNAAGAQALFWTADSIPNNVSSRTSWQQNEAWHKARFSPHCLLRLAANPYLLQIMAVLPVIPASRAQLFQGSSSHGTGSSSWFCTMPSHDLVVARAGLGCQFVGTP